MINSSKRYEITFFGIIAFSFCLWAVLFFINPQGNQQYVFFAGCRDFFADFFNVLRYIDGRNPYFTTVGSAGEHAYPAVAYLLLYPFTVFNDYTHMTLQDCWHSVPALMSAFLYMLALCFLLFHSLLVLKNELNERYDDNKINSLSVWAVVMTNVFLCSIERGNIIILSAVFLNYFLAFYDSKNKFKRIFAAFAVAMAASIKVYPVIFGFLYFEKKQWKEILYAFIFGIVLTFPPFFFFEHGIVGFLQLLKNVGIQSKSMSYMGGLNYLFGFAGLAYRFSAKLGISENSCMLMKSLCTVFLRLLSVYSIFLSLRTKDIFMRVCLTVFAVIFFPANSGFYQALYLFPLLLFYFVTLEKRSKSLNLLLLILFTLIFIPLQPGIYKSLPLNYEITNFSCFAMWLTVLYKVTVHT